MAKQLLKEGSKGADVKGADVVQKSYFLATNRGVKTIFKLKTLPKKFKNAPYRY
jgi:hypothetical protein